MKIGITGHQKLATKSTVKWLNRELLYEFNHLKPICRAYSSLAVGADQLFSKAVLQSNIDLIGVIPCRGYEKTFTEADRAIYFDLLARCKVVETLGFTQPSEEAFFSAGKHVADQSDIVFAIWDGKKAKGLGGTGDVVLYALADKKTVIHLNPISRIKQTYN